MLPRFNVVVVAPQNVFRTLFGILVQKNVHAKKKAHAKTRRQLVPILCRPTTVHRRPQGTLQNIVSHDCNQKTTNEYNTTSRGGLTVCEYAASFVVMVTIRCRLLRITVIG